MKKNPKKAKGNLQFTIILFALVIIGLIAIIYPSIYLRWHADDYCVAASTTSMTITEYFVMRYLTWTGRYSSIIFQGLYNLLGGSYARILPSIITILWLFSLSWASYPIFKKNNIPNPFLTALGISGLCLLFLFSIIPNLFQSVYWNNAAISYCLPLILFSLTFGVIIRLWFEILKGWGWTFPIIISTILAGGFSEVFIVVQVTFFALSIFTLLLFKDTKKRNRILPFMIAGFISALLALVVVANAPGNQVRQTLSGQHTAISHLPKMILENTIIIYYSMVEKAGWWTLLVVVISFIIGFIIPKSLPADIIAKTHFWKQEWVKKILITVACGLIITITAVTPSAYIQGQELEARSMVIPIYFIIINIMVVMCLLGVELKKSKLNRSNLTDDLKDLIIKLSVIFLIGTGVVFTIYHSIVVLPVYKNYAQLWDKRDQEIRNMAILSLEEITIYQLDDRYWGVSDIRDDPDYWVNLCLAKYYGVEKIIGR